MMMSEQPGQPSKRLKMSAGKDGQSASMHHQVGIVDQFGIDCVRIKRPLLFCFLAVSGSSVEKFNCVLLQCSNRIVFM